MQQWVSVEEDDRGSGRRGDLTAVEFGGRQQLWNFSSVIGLHAAAEWFLGSRIGHQNKKIGGMPNYWNLLVLLVGLLAQSPTKILNYHGPLMHASGGTKFSPILLVG